ncbi:MAG: hypothetical protein AB7I79_24185 [Rhizobiaceae bacterium]
MSTRTKPSFLGEVLSVMGDAIAAAAAVRQGRTPRSENLVRLGIDPDQFREIRRF